MPYWQSTNALRPFTLELLDLVVDIFIFYFEKNIFVFSLSFILFQLASDTVVPLDLKDTEASVQERKTVLRFTSLLEKF